MKITGNPKLIDTIMMAFEKAGKHKLSCRVRRASEIFASSENISHCTILIHSIITNQLFRTEHTARSYLNYVTLREHVEVK